MKAVGHIIERDGGHARAICVKGEIPVHSVGSLKRVGSLKGPVHRVEQQRACRAMEVGHVIEGDERNSRVIHMKGEIPTSEVEGG